MSAQDLVLKTKFEKQVPYPLLAEIAGAVKISVEKCPVFPEPNYLKMERIWDALYKLDAVANEATYAEDGDDLVDVRPYALAVIAEAVRYINTLPRIPETLRNG